MATFASMDDQLRDGRAAFAQQSWSAAYAHFSTADELAPLGIDDLERLAVSAFMLGRDEVSSELWMRAHSECLRLADVPRAVRNCFWLALGLSGRGGFAQVNGWIARAQRLLDDGHHDCAERGLMLVLVARNHLRQRNLAAAYDATLRAVEQGTRYPDPELNVFGRLMLAQVMVLRGETVAAASLFDEIMVAVTVGDVSPAGIGTVYCAVISTCHYVFDLARAREWTSALSRWCDGQPDLVPFRGQCMVHRTEVMRLSGAWSQAMSEAEHAISWLIDSAKHLDAANGAAFPSFKYPIGAAFYQLAELHRLRGDFAEAEAAYRQASEYGESPETGMALLRMAQGRTAVAAAAIRRMLGETQGPGARAAVLAAAVDILIKNSDLTTARIAAEELSVLAADSSAVFLRALSAQYNGAVLIAEGDNMAALALLRDALIAWQEIEAPYEAARVRVLIGISCRALGDHTAADLELEAAERVFQRLGAAPDSTRVSALRRSVADSDPVLTPRELQVIGLMAPGKTNRAIARELSISERTVDRHVSNILSKLDLSSRTAATAYAYEHGLV